jgi:biopolymer transport protein ExbD
MAMNLPSGGGSGEPDVVVDMNTTPLIDVMLVLLVMLIITIPIQTHAVKLDMPTATPPLTDVKPEVVDIDVDFDGTVLWNGQVQADRTTLENNFRQIAVRPDQPEVHVKPNKLATYKYVATVMASAQRLGITKIGIVGSEQFSE